MLHVRKRIRFLLGKDMYQVLTRFDVLIACKEKYVISN